MDDSLYDRPELYDLMSPADAVWTRFYVELAKARGGRVLDLACGTRRFTLPLAQAGLDVTAGDLSVPMLERARAEARATGVAIDFHQLDMRDFSLEGRFESIILAANSILHLHSPDDFAGFFSSVSRHLAPGGQLIFDAFVPSVGMLSRSPTERHPVGAFGVGDNAARVEETIHYDPTSQVSHVEWIWSRADAPDFWRHRLDMRQIFPQEMPVLLAAHGFTLLQRYGDFDGSPLSAKSRRQICVCGVAG
ncbi:class I SAM-dependent methyltransferase [Devosia sp.]|uniref:class I SAM-dependent methyltransferase n=1 Tax=Devosia sp. TaxID=1871048 RepID=UPI003A8D5781